MRLCAAHEPSPPSSLLHLPWAGAARALRFSDACIAEEVWSLCIQPQRLIRHQPMKQMLHHSPLSRLHIRAPVVNQYQNAKKCQLSVVSSRSSQFPHLGCALRERGYFVVLALAGTTTRPSSSQLMPSTWHASLHHRDEAASTSQHRGT